MKTASNLVLIVTVGTIAFLNVGCKNLDVEAAQKKQESEHKEVVGSVNNLSIDLPLDTVNLQNLDNYLIEGKCSSERGSIEITFPNFSTTTECTATGEFSANLNLTDQNENDLANLTIEQEELRYVLSESDVPVVDLIAISEAPIFQDQSFVTTDEHKINFYCSEIGEEVHFSGAGLEPNIQIHKCSSSSLEEEATLTLALSTETDDLNQILVRSFDSNNNPSELESSFILPVDNKKPVVTILGNGDVREGEVATFTVNIEEGNLDFSALDFLPSSGWVSSPACESFPCLVEVSEASEGNLQLFVERDRVIDLAGNCNAEEIVAEIQVEKVEFNFASAD